MFVQSCETDLKISTFVELRKCYETNNYCTAIHVRRLFVIISGIKIARFCLQIMLTVTKDLHSNFYYNSVA